MMMMTLSPISSESPRWRSVLMTKKWSPRGREKKQINQLPTVIAAATEKVVTRQGRYQQCVQSEDLTATQFASLAGIIIKDSDENGSDDDFCDQPKRVSILIPVARSSSSSSSSSSNHSHYQKSQVPQIWDSAFWQHQQQQQQQQQQHDDGDNDTPLSGKFATAAKLSSSLSTSPSYASTSSSSCSERSISTLSPPVLSRSSGPSVIHKGRFKIVLGHDDGDTKPIEPQCVEWRRKRASTN